MAFSFTPQQALVGVGVLLALWWVRRAGARRARASAEAARAGARLVSLFGRVMVTAAVIVGVQWIVITHPHPSRWLLVAVLGGPAVFASYALTRALTVTTVDTPRRRGGGRR
jgi:hypothetical protein